LGYSNAKAWDGKRNGVDLPVGVYYYIIRLNNSQPLLKGGVSIIK
jgi:hypothetical protein